MRSDVSIANLSGIYQIRNDSSRKIYIGSSCNIGRRIARHQYKLRRGIHPNRHLQNSWARHGEAVFAVSVLEEVPVQKLIEREQWHIDNSCCLDRRYGYNIAPSAQCVKLSDETKKRIGDAHRGKPDPNQSARMRKCGPTHRRYFAKMDTKKREKS